MSNVMYDQAIMQCTALLMTPINRGKILMKTRQAEETSRNAQILHEKEELEIYGLDVSWEQRTDNDLNAQWRAIRRARYT